MDDSADKKDTQNSTDKGRSSKRSKEDRKAKELSRSRHTDSSGEISSIEPGAFSETKSGNRYHKERKARRNLESGAPTPGVCSTSRGSGSGKDRDREAKERRNRESGVSTPGACSSSRGSKSGKDRDREAKERRKGGGLSTSRHSKQSRQDKERRKGGKSGGDLAVSEHSAVSRRSQEERKAARKQQRSTLVANRESNVTPSAENAKLDDDALLLQATLIPNDDTKEPAGVPMEGCPPGTGNNHLTETPTSLSRPFNHQALQQNNHDSSDQDWERNATQNAGRCYRSLWFGVLILIGAAVGAYFAFAGKEDTSPGQDLAPGLSVSIYLPPSADDCLAVEAGLKIEGQNDLASRSLETVFVVVLANEEAAAQIEFIMKAIFKSMVEDMTCCSENVRRLSHSRGSAIRGGFYESHRMLQNKDCVVANAEVSTTTTPRVVNCNAIATGCGGSQDGDNDVQTVEVKTNFSFYLKGDEDDELLIQTMGDALKEGQKNDFGLPRGQVLSIAARPIDSTSSAVPLTSDPTSAPSITPPMVPPLTVSPSQAESVPSASPSEAIPAETTNPTLKPTKAPSIAPAPDVTPLPTDPPSMKPSATPTPGPTKAPTVMPTPGPTGFPTLSPSESPSANPSASPTQRVTPLPTMSPTKRPTTSPSVVPSQSPSTVADARRAMIEGILSDHAPFDQQAMSWLAETDTWQPDADDPNSNYMWLERYALVALYYSTNGDNWTYNAKWLSAEPVCNWTFVHSFLYNTCPGPLGSLVLVGNNLQGSLPGVITKLSRLYYFMLQNNAITGTIPEIAENSSMYAFHLGLNQLSGTIPESIGNLGSLTNLALLHNQLSGTIPQSITSLTSLQLLYLRGNTLGETLPTYISQLDNLVVMDLTSTGLKGTIPSFLKDMQSLRYIELGYNFNEVSGTFPSFLLEMTKLEGIALDGTYMTGTIPENIGVLTGLRTLNLSVNAMVGSIPESLSALTLLLHFYMQSNYFTGTIPVLPENQLQGCLIWGNCFSDNSNGVARGCVVDNSWTCVD
ncbi:unnamed protein product [Cylindrotheca closterium]|uniref:Uncharacterized protein n=1 Tax=Cylindrotheca closterium TaxID=2856 RepID=A0AAD2FGE9_9STRA|nr:unnamed protein product [Cylindrotheca closterium]